MTIRELAGNSGLSKNEVRAAIHKLMYKPVKHRAHLEERIERRERFRRGNSS